MVLVPLVYYWKVVFVNIGEMYFFHCVTTKAIYT